MLVRTITKGLTIFVKAIDTNSTKAVKHTISFAPRGERAKCALLVEDDTQDISPLELGHRERRSGGGARHDH